MVQATGSRKTLGMKKHVPTKRAVCAAPFSETAPLCELWAVIHENTHKRDHRYVFAGIAGSHTWTARMED
jgi:hypothetical protein